MEVVTTPDNVRAGVVKWFDEKKGYGFINPDYNPAIDVFVHYSAVPGSLGRKNLMEGDKVTYLEGTRDDGLFAVKVMTVVRS